MLIRRDQSCLILVDVQEKLINSIFEHQRLVANCEWLMRAARELHVPIILSEQYPQGLGNAVNALRDLFPTITRIEKVHFSCASDKKCLNQINQLGKEQIILIGIEAHVCVLQTAIELNMLNKQVFVVADAVSSRDPHDAVLALERMRALGIQIVSKEMVLFEWLHQSATPEFRKISKAFLRA